MVAESQIHACLLTDELVLGGDGGESGILRSFLDIDAASAVNIGED